jgi:hypothetical protein
MPPRDIMLRLEGEFRKRIKRGSPGSRESGLTPAGLLAEAKAPDMAIWHQRIMGETMPWAHSAPVQEVLDREAGDERQRVMTAANLVMSGMVTILSPRPVQVFSSAIEEIDWFLDYRSGLAWSFDWAHDLDVADLDRNSDVKFPWELSRLQWLLPVGQAWALSGDDKFAAFARSVFEHWMDKNPTAWGVNWSCAMEPAMRVFVWCWFYVQLSDSPSWHDEGYRFRFLRGLYLHLAFVRRFIEISDVNGNHLTAEAAALVVGGQFFSGRKVHRWRAVGWRLLRRDILSQVYPDGVNFEGSTYYHRLVAELFHVAAVVVDGNCEEVPDDYRNRLLRMADYTDAYTRPDGVAPVIGDNDDACVLPLGGLPRCDHRYLPMLIRRAWDPGSITNSWKNTAAECLWWWGNPPEIVVDHAPPPRTDFLHGGMYMLRSDQDFVLFNCASLGLGGRGGHSHNDALSFELVLAGQTLAVDPGCFTYTGDYHRRNEYRGTASHSTPQVGTEEINRLVSERLLWVLRPDATVSCLHHEDSPAQGVVSGMHTGYQRLSPAVTITRKISLDKVNHVFSWEDKFDRLTKEVVSVPVQLAPDITVMFNGNSRLTLEAGGIIFLVCWEQEECWKLTIEPSVVAPGYGVEIGASKLVWRSACAADLFRAMITPI